METTDYCSYELSLALKKAGFCESCNYGYSVKTRIEPEVSFGEPKIMHSKAPKNYNDNRKGIEKGLDFCSAPTLWQAQKWLREKYGIHIDICIYPDYSVDADGNVCDKWDYWGFDLHAIVGSEQILADCGKYNLYEEALATGIEVALKLLDNQK